MENRKTRKNRGITPVAMVIYDSLSGHTLSMARAIARGLRQEGIKVEVIKTTDVKLDDMVKADAIVLGSPDYFCSMSYKMKALVDESVVLFPGKLKDKVGAVFASGGGIGGGIETTALSMALALLMHQMVIVGHQSGSTGAICPGKPDDACLESCREFGQRIAKITLSLVKPKENIKNAAKSGQRVSAG
ncbi:MAG: flavodoxin family protein [Dehalococcoidia bacterium]|nr:flavodoxin family protein [Dehalococcoidia bacterium]MDZ4247519.1 flavodoxin family protein [Dehalococcoidia bacterium]